MIRWVGFDADDTLWQSQSYFDAAQEAYEQILSRYLDVADDRVHAHLLETERRNVRFFGYGAKGMILSMLEAAVALTEERISGADVRHILELGMDVLQHPVELLPGAREAVEQVARHYEIVTPGKTFHVRRLMASLDRFALSRELGRAATGVHISATSRLASDHFPIWIDLDLTPPPLSVDGG